VCRAGNRWVCSRGYPQLASKNTRAICSQLGTLPIPFPLVHLHLTSSPPSHLTPTKLSSISYIPSSAPPLPAPGEPANSDAPRPPSFPWNDSPSTTADRPWPPPAPPQLLPPPRRPMGHPSAPSSRTLKGRCLYPSRNFGQGLTTAGRRRPRASRSSARTCSLRRSRTRAIER
jgi:hypothetical protein